PGQQLERLLAGARDRRGVAGALQEERARLRHVPLVVDDQHLRRRRLVRAPAHEIRCLFGRTPLLAHSAQTPNSLSVWLVLVKPRRRAAPCCSLSTSSSRNSRIRPHAVHTMWSWCSCPSVCSKRRPPSPVSRPATNPASSSISSVR